MEGNILNKPRKCDRDYELNKKKKLPTSVKDKTIIVIKKGSKNTKCRCDSFHFQVLSGNRAYYSHIKWQVQLYKHSVTLSCRFFFFFFLFSLHYLYIDLTGNMVIYDTWYNFLNLWRVWTWQSLLFYFLLYLQWVTRSWKSSMRSINTFTFPPLHPPKILSLLVNFVATFRFSITKDSSFLLNFWPGDLNNQFF